jgi:hypothetical protein
LLGAKTQAMLPLRAKIQTRLRACYASRYIFSVLELRPHQCFISSPMPLFQAAMKTMGPTRAYRARKPRIFGLQWPKPLYFRLIVLGGHKSRSVACLLLPRCLLRRCTGFRVTWGQENGPRSSGIGGSEWEENPHRHGYVCGCTCIVLQASNSVTRG